MTKPQRGPVGMAAEALKETLVARLQPGVKDSVINDGLFRAIKHIDAFLHVHKETQAELDELKAVVRSIVLKAAHGPSAAAAGGQDGTQERPRSESSVLQSRPRALHTSASLRSRSSGQSSSAATADIDWTMPQSLVNSKAFVRQRHSYGRMMMAQDELTRRAEEERAAGRWRAMEQTRAMYDQQMEAVDERRRAEKQELRNEQAAMDEALRQYQRDEEQRRRQQQEAQAATRQVFRQQVEEVIERRQEERREEERERYLDKLAAEEVAREERERQARVARENKERRAQMKAELAAAMRLKAEVLAKEQEEERELNIANMKAMDAKEQARLAVLKARADWQRMLYERGGGAALQASLEEQARLDAERAARAQAEFERKQEELQRRKHEQRKKEVEEMVASVKEQLAWKEAQHMQAVEDKRAARAAAMAQWAADQQQRKAELAAKRQVQREAFAQEQHALMQDRRRRFKEHTDPINPKELWVHKQVEGGGGLYRNFVNLAVPQHFTVRGSLQADSVAGAAAISAA